MRVNVLLVDYGAGNLHSIGKALAREGADVTIALPSADALARAHAVVLPGVGAFGAACDRLRPVRDDLRAALRAGLPCLGICLGMQLLFESSDEGPGEGLGVLGGRVRRLRSARTPHIGWNTVRNAAETEERHFYFAHGFVAEPADTGIVDSWSELDGDRFPASVRERALRGVQFHPEKSGAAGLALIRDFVEGCA